MAAGATLSACAPSPAAHWVGKEPLSDTTVSVKHYAAVPGLPDLTAPVAARAAGMSDPTPTTPTHARGRGWSVSVEQSDFATRIVMGRDCGTPARDTKDVTAAAEGLYERLGGQVGEQAWFSVAAQGTDRVFAEPLLDDTQTWSTGFLVARVDTDGVCSLSGTVMAFRESGTPTTFTSAADAFLVAEEGTYDAAEQTYTLGTAGRLVPAWRFSGRDGSAMVVDLGDGLESAPDSATYLDATSATQK